MVSSNSDKRRGWRIALGALALGTVAMGFTATPALADRDDGHRGRVEHRGNWDRGQHYGWDYRWHRPEARFGFGYYGYDPYYVPPPVIYEAPPPTYYPPAYYPGSFNVTIPVR